MRRVIFLIAMSATFGCGGDSSTAADAATPDAAAPDGSTLDGSTPDGSTPDGSVVWPDGCGAPTPEWTPLTVGEPGTCEDFVACGGDIVGAWDLSGGCFEVAIMDALADCPGAAVTRREGRGRGCVEFGADGQAHRVAESEVEIDLFVPALCAGFVSCATIESQIRLTGVAADCPVDSDGGCRCAARLDTRIDQRDGYTTEADEIVGTVSGKRWQYCVAGDVLSYIDTSPSGMLEPGTVELTRR